MATHESALKRARQNEKKRQRNGAVKSMVKTSYKKVFKAIEEKNPQTAREALIQAIPTLQKASGKRVIHKKSASRRISRLTKKVNALASSVTPS